MFLPHVRILRLQFLQCLRILNRQCLRPGLTTRQQHSVLRLVLLT